MRKYFKKDIETKSDTIPRSYDKNTDSASHASSAKKGWLCEEDFISLKPCSKCKKTGDHHLIYKENGIGKDHCHLSSRIWGLAHNQCKLNTRKADSSFVPILFSQLSGNHSYLMFEKLFETAIERILK